MVRLPPATRIDRFEIKSLIGSGGMGTLYLARDTSPNTYRLVALKLLNANLDSEDLRERFSRESQALASLSHPNVVNIHECGEYRGSPYIVMEYVRGETLAEKIKRRAPLSLSEKLKLMMELCGGLAHAHEAGIIHRDIKPANLMVDHHGRLRLLDFGIARVAETGVTLAGVPMTQIHMRIGTPGYMSPEQYEGAEIDRRSDIFAVGVVFHELLTYREVFPGTTTRQIEKRVLESQPERLTEAISGLDPAIEALVMRALEKNPDGRFQDAAEMERALEKIWWRLGLAESASPQKPTPQPASGAGKKGSRAEAAYQRAVSSLAAGAPEAAKRHAMEALAEDSKHEGARAFLQKHDPNFRLPAPSPPPRPREQTVDAGDPTIVVSRDELNLADIGREPAGQDPTIVGVSDLGADQTLVAPAGRRRTGSGKRAVTSPAAGKKKADGTATATPAWQRMALVGVALVAVTGGAALIAVLAQKWMNASAGALPLTIIKPVNGTIVGHGVNCGTRGSECTISVTPDQAVTLRLVADAGFAPGGYTEDCPASGQFLMTAARTCGATFVRAGSAAAISADIRRHTLTIFATDGGVVRVGGAECRSKRGGCAEQFPEGQVADLEFLADRGYTFERFTGACDSDGRVTMTEAKTCGASFVSNSPTAVSPTPPPRTSASTPPKVETVPLTIPKKSPVKADPPGPPPSATTPTITPVAPPTSGTAPPVNPGTNPVGPNAPPPPPPTKSDEEIAKDEITELLEAYRKAYEALDYTGVKRVYPTAQDFTAQLRDYKSMTVDQGGDPKVKLDLPSGTATVAMAWIRKAERTNGVKQQANLALAIGLTRKTADNRWVIQRVTFATAR